jgi:site-specific DNA recombinase
LFYGNNTSGRAEFQKLLEDSRNDKIDMIITKSISRFGRNTSEVLDEINRLSSHGIDIFFETENIHTSETDKTFLISLIEAFAQAESEARSQNIKWGIKRGFETGESKLYSRKCYGYRQDCEANLVIEPNEAKIVKLIFDLYLSGYSVVGIIRELNNQGIKSPTGKDAWNKRTLEMLLCNEKYIGNVLVGKTYGNDFPNNKRLMNNGERQKYVVSSNHPAIISEEQFEAVKLERENRSNVAVNGNKETRKSSHYSMKVRLDDGLTSSS